MLKPTPLGLSSEHEIKTGKTAVGMAKAPGFAVNLAFMIQFDHRCASDKDIKTIHNTSKPRRLQAAVRTQLVETKRRCTPKSNAIDKRL